MEQVQHKKVQHGRSATWKIWDMEKEQHGKSKT